MMSPDMQALIDAPLADPNRVYLPAGKAKAKRGPKPQYHAEDLPRLSGKKLKERKAATLDKKLSDILTYYAGTDVPVDRIVSHTGLDEQTVRRCLKDRGRIA